MRVVEPSFCSASRDQIKKTRYIITSFFAKGGVLFQYLSFFVSEFELRIALIDRFRKNTHLVTSVEA